MFKMSDATINEVINEMTLGEILTGLKDEVMALLNSSAFSTDSIEGWIVILLCVIIVYKVTKEAYDFIGWCVQGGISVPVHTILIAGRASFCKAGCGCIYPHA
jgi:hypothetical protein